MDERNCATRRVRVCVRASVDAQACVMASKYDDAIVDCRFLGIQRFYCIVACTSSLWTTLTVGYLCHIVRRIFDEAYIVLRLLFFQRRLHASVLI